MGFTVSRDYQRESVGLDQLRVNVLDLTFDNSYDAANGEVLTAAECGFQSEILAVVPCGILSSGHVPQWSPTLGAFQIFFADYDAVADGALIELTNASAALNGATLRVVAIGR